MKNSGTFYVLYSSGWSKNVKTRRKEREEEKHNTQLRCCLGKEEEKTAHSTAEQRVVGMGKRKGTKRHNGHKSVVPDCTVQAVYCCTLLL